MELEDKSYFVTLNLEEVIELLSQESFNQLEKAVREKAEKQFGEEFKRIECSETNASNMSFILDASVKK